MATPEELEDLTRSLLGDWRKLKIGQHTKVHKDRFNGIDIVDKSYMVKHVGEVVRAYGYNFDFNPGDDHFYIWPPKDWKPNAVPPAAPPAPAAPEPPPTEVAGDRSADAGEPVPAERSVGADAGKREIHVPHNRGGRRVRAISVATGALQCEGGPLNGNDLKLISGGTVYAFAGGAYIQQGGKWVWHGPS